MEKNKSIKILLILLLVICLSGVGIVLKNAKEMNKKQEETEVEHSSEVVVEVTTEASTEAVPEATTEEKIDNPIDFAKQKERNPDIYAWIRIPDTEVDYPLLHSIDGDVDHYLDYTVDGEEGLPGSIYTQYNCNPHLSEDPVTIVYGHNMRNESMFGSLKHYKEKEYRKKHPLIYIYSPKHVYVYQLMFAVTYDDRYIMDQYHKFETKEDYQDFLNSLREVGVDPSWFKDPFELTTDDQLLVLSTCNGNGDQRFLVGAKMIKMQ